MAVGSFLNAVTSFLLKAAGLYFMIVLPVSRFAVKKPAPPAPPNPEVVLLVEIRDLLKAQRT